MRKALFCLALVTSLICQTLTAPVFAESDVRIIYVNSSSGNDTADGTSGRKALKTIEKAIELADNDTSDAEIRLADGTYFLESELNISGNILFRPIKNENANVIISGGKKISNFEIFDSQKNIYRARYSGDSRELYVNGKPAVRAKSNDSLGLVFNSESGTFKTDDASILNFKNINKVELVFKKTFVSRRTFINSVQAENGGASVSIDSSMLYNLTNTAGVLLGNGESPWYIENAYELLDESGEWYTDGEYVYYKPFDGENMYNSDVVASNLEKPVNICGIADNPVSNITIQNITFSHGTWKYPNGNRGIIDSQNNVIASSMTAFAKGAVNVSYADNITFDNCTFENSGGNGLNIMNGGKNITVSNCEFKNISACGIQIGDVNETEFPDEKNAIENITVEKNLIHDCGKDYRSASGIGLAFAKNCSFLHNEIYNLPYCGMHIGWGWSYRPDSITEGIKIKYNYIHDCMNELNDGGLIYTLGGTNNKSGSLGKYNEISYNYLQDVHGIGGLLYNDEGSNYWNMHHNVIEQNDEFEGFCWYDVAPNTNNLLNQFNYLSSDEKKYFRSRDKIMIDMMKTNVMYTPPMSVAQTGEMIIKNAGVKESTFISFDEALENAEYKNTEFFGNDAIIKDGGYIDFNCDTVGKTFDFCVFPEGGGTYDIDIDSKYKIVVSDNEINVYMGSTNLTPTPLSVQDWSNDRAGDVSLTLDSNQLVFSSGNCRRINWNYPITNGRVKITVHGMSMSIGSLSRHISYYKELMKPENLGKNIISNSYFENNLDGWNTNYTSVEKSGNGYGGSLGSMKVVVNKPIGNYPNVNTSASFELDKWYRISTFVYTDKEGSARFYMNSGIDFDGQINDKWASCGGDLYKTKNTYSLKRGWNYISEYISLTDFASARVYIMLESAKTGDTYYLDNFEIIEETQNCINYNFEQYKGQWNGQEIPVNWIDGGYNSEKAISFNSIDCDVSYPHPYVCEKLDFGKSYHARAMVRVDEFSGEESNVYFGVSDLVSNDIGSYIGYNKKPIVLGSWLLLEFDFAWSREENAYLQVFFTSGNRGNICIDNVEVFEVPVKSDNSINSDFLNGMCGWYVHGDMYTEILTGNGVRVISKSADAKLYQNVYIKSGTDYYVEGFIKLDEDKVATGNIMIKKDGKNISLNDCDFAMTKDTIKSQEICLSSERWTKIGGVLNASVMNLINDGFNAEFCAEVKTPNGENINYSIKGLRVSPCSKYSTLLSKAEINSDMTVTYCGEGMVRYRYFDNGELINSGYVSTGNQLPDMECNGEGYAELTTVSKSGKDEITVYSNNIKSGGGAYSRFMKSDDDLYLIYNNNSGTDLPYVVYFAEYDNFDRLLRVELQNKILSKSGGIIKAEKTGISNAEAAREKIFIWDNNFKPLKME